MSANDYSYCGKCYCFQNNYPFGFCKECWIKAGKPKPVRENNGLDRT